MNYDAYYMQHCVEVPLTLDNIVTNLHVMEKHGGSSLLLSIGNM
jgi:hypothetical protein